MITGKMFLSKLFVEIKDDFTFCLKYNLEVVLLIPILNGIRYSGTPFMFEAINCTQIECIINETEYLKRHAGLF